MKRSKKEKIITFSLSAVLPVNRCCRNRCGYCGFATNDYGLAVPYNTIKVAKSAVKKGAKEILIVAGERPDRFQPIKNTLDLWGFPSYVRYLYTICELAFLEGLLPKICVGYLTLPEMALLREVSVALEVYLGATQPRFFKNPVHQYAPSKSREVIWETFENAGRLKIPVSVNFLVGVGEKISERKEELNLIRELHEKYGHIQEVVFDVFRPMPGTPLRKQKQIKNSELISIIRLARKILPPKIALSTRPDEDLNILLLLKAGIQDLSSIPLGGLDCVTNTRVMDFSELKKKLKRNKIILRKRLPIYSRYIQMGWYSGKMGQLLDRYREEIKEVSY